MAQRQFMEHAISDWMRGTGPDSEIVISSRIRVARNLCGVPFPLLATNQQSVEVLNQLAAVIEQPEMSGFHTTFHRWNLAELSDLEKQVLVEKHLISPALVNESRNGAVILSEDESISIMLNEEDHLRIQCLYPGLQIREAWEQASRIDDVFEAHVDYAFDRSGDS